MDVLLVAKRACEDHGRPAGIKLPANTDIGLYQGAFHRYRMEFVRVVQRSFAGKAVLGPYVIAST